MASQDLVYRFLGLDDGAGAQFDRMASKTALLGKSSDTALKSIKRLAIGAGVVATIIGVESVKAAANFQTELTKIHTQADASTATVAKLGKGILNMSSAVATAPTQLASAAFHIASVGQKSLTAAQQLAVLKMAAEGAKVGGANLTDVTNALTSAVVSGIHGVQNYSQTMGVLNATVGAGDMTMQDLADAMSSGVTTAAATAGLSIQSLGAAIAVFGDNNIRGETAGQRLTRVIMLMQAPSKAAAAALASIGIGQTQLASDLRKPNGLTVALDDLREHLKRSGLTAVQQAQVIAEAFGKSRGAANVELLLREVDRLGNKFHIVSHDGKNFASSWAGYTKTFGYAWDRMRASVQKMVIEFGTKLLPTATRVINWMTNHTKVLVVAAGAWAAFRVGAILATAAMAAFDVAAAANPVGAIVLALEAVTAGFIIAYEKSETFRKIVQRVFVDLATAAGYWAKYNLLAFKMVLDAFFNFAGTMIHGAADAFGWIPGIGGKLKGAAHAFDDFRSSVDNTLTNLANDAGNLGSLAGGLFAWHFMGAANSAMLNAQGYGTKSSSPFHDPGHPGYSGPHAAAKPKMPHITIPGGGGGGGSTGATKSAANLLHVTAKGLISAIQSGLLNGWQGFSLTVEDGLSSGTRNLLNALGKQFKAISDGMAKLVKDARTKLANDLKAQTQFVQQMMSDAALSNVPTTASGYTGQTTRLTNIGSFLGSQAQSYAAFAKALKRLAHSGLSKGLINQIAQMGPTAGLQYAQQILSNPSMIGQINAYQKQIQASAKAIGQDQYGSQIQADRRNLHRQTELQERMAKRLDHLAHDIAMEIKHQVGGGTTITLNGKTVGLTPHEVQKLLSELERYKRRMGK